MTTTLIIDLSKINSTEDILKWYFSSVECPAWHGENLDAVNDSLVTGSINDDGPPYNFIVHNKSEMNSSSAKVIYEMITESVNENGGTI